jgi:phosphatidylglycerol:prolipoprotein diacylglycerol transferase
MHPILFQWGPITIYSYGVLVATGVLLGLWIARWQAPRAGVSPDLVWNVGIYMVLSALVCAKLWLVSLYSGYYWAHPRELFALSTLQSGGTFYGGILGAFALLVFYKFVKKVKLLPLMDCYGLGLPLGHAIGRLGCFAAGCCYGKPTWLPWGVTYTNPKAAELVGTPLNIALHPTQIYESIAELANFLFILWLARRQRFTGQLVAAYLILYGVERGLMEFLRGDPDRTLMFHGAVSLMQVVSVGMIIFGVLIWRRGSKQQALVPAHAHR